MLGNSIIKATAKGKRDNQQNSINWSYRSRGKVALNQTNIKQKIQVLRPKIILCKFIIELLTSNSGIFHPPKKKIAVMVLNKTIEEYSARKKNTKIILECSVKKPATNSDSNLSIIY